jgi:hypothetical protein
MPKVGSFTHTITHAVNLSATTSYATARRHNLDLMSDTIPTGSVPFSGFIDSVTVHMNTIAGGATTLTLRLTSDLAGDNTIFGDTTATISTGVTTATDGAVTIKIGAIYGSSSDNLYLFWKTDAGTATVDTLIVNWSE